MALTFSSAAVNAAGQQLTVTLTVGLPPVSTLSASTTAVGFTLTADGNSVGLGLWVFTSTDIRIQLTDRVYAGQVLLVSYDGTGGVQDAAASALSTFTNQTVTNNSTQEALSAYALTTLDGLKLHLRIADTDNDALLTQTINQVSGLIERVTGRNFLARDYRERYNGQHQRAITLKQYPVQHMTRVSYGWANAMRLSFTGSAIRANASIYRHDSLEATGGLRLVSVSSAGSKTVSSLLFSEYPSVSELVTAVNLVSGWTAVTDVNIPSRDLNPNIAGDALARTVWLTYPDQDDVAYTLDSENGILQFADYDESWFYGRYRSRPQERGMPWGFQGFLVEYNAGYSSIPDDVDLLCRELCGVKFYAGEDNPSIKSESTGPYSVSFTDDDFLTIRQRLAHYIDARAMIA